MSQAQLDRIEDKVDEILVNQATMTEQGRSRQKSIDELRDTVFGNGTPGLKVRVQSIEEHCAGVCADLRKMPSTFKRILIATIPNIISALLLAYIFWQLAVYVKFHAVTP